MIEQLHIINVALIDDLEINLKDGLNILSGETGAGKSIIIDAINFVMGGKTDKDFIRTNTDSARVDALARVSALTAESIRAAGLELDEDLSLLISRTINTQGRSTIRINGKTITIGMLREISVMLVDIHGQHEHQSLLNPARHIELLDRFCGDIAKHKENLSERVKTYRELVKQISYVTTVGKERSQLLDMYEFQKRELDNAKLKLNEEEELVRRQTVLSSTDKILSCAGLACELLYGSENAETSAYDLVSKSLSLLGEAAQYDHTLTELQEMTELTMVQINEAAIKLRRYLEKIDHDPKTLDEVEERLDTIYTIKRKYGGSISEAIKYHEKITNELNLVEDNGHQLNLLNKQKKIIEDELLELCQVISQLRKEASEDLSKKILVVLHDLGMAQASFEIIVERKKENGTNGYDRVEFLISPNLGEPLKPLARIASGGEMSRVMLALKTVLAHVDNIETFIFDEIDAGVSGRTAQCVAERLCDLAQTNQILCISHLPQIVAMADVHFLIEKSSDETKTTTSVTELAFDSSVNEIARLIGGAEITDFTIRAAQEMKVHRRKREINIDP